MVGDLEVMVVVVVGLGGCGVIVGIDTLAIQVLDVDELCVCVG